MIQAKLLVAPPEVAQKQVLVQVQQLICPQHTKECAQCLLLHEKKHRNLLWLVPSKQQYSLADLEIIGELSQFARALQDPFCIVISQAHTLTVACANSLLKFLEEPPPGYFIFLLTPSLETLLPTIISRCVVEISSIPPGTAHPLVQLLLKKQASFAEFSSKLEESALREWEAREMLDALISEYYKIEHIRAVTLLLELRDKLPMPGSAKLFWRTVFLALQQVH